ncbi:MAG TPA: DUF4097 family beta strand repeat-containing protein [Acidimicrobiia bacterium]|nr:DUF4097 family beta strand repeat-containing protein [Acidimicrobiia bacterium]
MAEPAESPRTVRVTSRNGAVKIVADSPRAISVEGGTVSGDDVDSDRFEVAGQNQPILVRCPPGTDVVVGTSSGRVELHGELGDARVTTQSGRISIDSAASVDARTRSGRIAIDRCAGSARLQCTSGRIEVGDVAELDAATQSGRIAGERVGRGHLSAVSGRVDLGAADGFSALEVTTVSGAVDISVPHESCPTTVLETVSGQIACDLPPGEDGRVVVRTTSGRIRVRER